MRFFLPIIFLFFLGGCKDQERNELVFTPFVEKQEVPLLDMNHQYLKIGATSNVNLQLNLKNSGVSSTAVALIDEGMSQNDLSFLHDRIKDFVYKDIEGENTDENFLVMGDERFFKVSYWKDQYFFPVEHYLNHLDQDHQLNGELQYQLKVIPELLDDIDSISNIVIGTYVYDVHKGKMERIGSQKLVTFEGEDEVISENYLDITYGIQQSNIHGGYLLNSIANRNNIYARVDDYIIHFTNGTSLKHDDIMQRHRNSFCLVILSFDGQIRSFYAKVGVSLKEILNQKGYLIHLNGADQLVAVNKVQNSLKLPVEWNHLSTSDLDLGIWRVHGAKRMTQEAEAGKTYVIAYENVRSIAPKKVVKESKSIFSGEYIAIPSISAGDIIELEVEGAMIIPTFKTVLKNVLYEYPIHLRRVVELPSGHYQQFATDFSFTKKTCAVLHRQKTGDFERAIFFTHDYLAERLEIKIQSKKYSLNDLLIEGNEASIIKNGLTAKFRIKIPVDAPQILIKLLPFFENVTEEIGFIGWHDCPDHLKSGFKLKGYLPEKKLEYFPIRQRLDFQFKMEKIL